MTPSSGEPMFEERADFSICIFPHLTEFLVIDARRDTPDGPSLCSFTTDQVLDEPFYSDIEAEFRDLLRRPNEPLSYLINLPQQLETILRHRAMNSIVKAVSGGVPTNLPEQVAVLTWSGDILNVSPDQVADIFSQLTGGEADQERIARWVDQFERLQKLERLEVRKELEVQRREAVIPKDGEFYTLWENPHKPG
ncbi:MAG: hypothetical protein O7D33_05285 [Chloroflexi bacterium]|nr:hypothetical protein [Chloroflexota bacterium]